MKKKSKMEVNYTDALEFVSDILRKAMLAHGIHEDSVMQVMSSIMFDESVRPADRLRSVEIFSKLAGLTVERKKIEVSGVSIGIETPEDLEL